MREEQRVYYLAKSEGQRLTKLLKYNDKKLPILSIVSPSLGNANTGHEVYHVMDATVMIFLNPEGYNVICIDARKDRQVRKAKKILENLADKDFEDQTKLLIEPPR